MKKKNLRTSFFLCCLVGIISFTLIEKVSGFSLKATKSCMKKTTKDNVFNIFQPSNLAIIDKFGILNQVCAGVNIHFVTGHEAELDMIAAAGFKYIRMDFETQSMEKTKGVYDWRAYDELTNNVEKRGMHAIYILDYSSSLYEKTIYSRDPITQKERKDTTSPQHSESIAAFAHWAAAAAEHFKGRKIIWEIWNEPNAGSWKPKPDVAQYVSLALATCKAIKALVPEATIIGPASSGIPMPFLESFLASGILEYLDGLSIHPYRNYSNSPETASLDYQILSKLIDRYNSQKKVNIPIICSEWGYSTFTKGILPDVQAAYIVRMQLINLVSGIPISIWYDWKDDGENFDEKEQNFGIVTSELKPKLAYIAVRTMNEQLNGFTFVRRIYLKDENDFALLFINEKGQYKITAWTTGLSHPISIDGSLLKRTSARGVDGSGNVLRLKRKRGELILNLTPLPQYISF